MKPLKLWLKLIRWSNLIVIAFTQILFYSCINKTLLSEAIFNSIFPWTVFICVFCAAAGYIINDYFDIEIDAINKPNSLVISNGISKKNAITGYLLLIVFTEIASIYVDLQLRSCSITIMTTSINILLFFYSKYWKKSFLIGNLIVAIITTAPILYCFLPIYMKNYQSPQLWVKISVIFIYFSFMICFIREIVKDMEDEEGDKLLNSKSLAIIFGQKRTKSFVMLLSSILVLSVMYFAYWFYDYEIWLFSLYIIALIAFPMVYFMVSLKNANTSKDFHHGSSLLKVIMLTGILFLIFLKLIVGALMSIFI